MAQTVLTHQWNSTSTPGAAASWTADLPIDVGTGSNRRIAVKAGYIGSTLPQPATLSIGSDVLSQVATFTNISGFKGAIFEGALSVTGSQSITGTATGATGAEGGGYLTEAIVVQGDSALTFGNLTAVAIASTGSGTFTRSRTPNSTAGAVAYMLMLDYSGTLSAVAGAGTTQIASSAWHWIGQRTASGATVTLNADLTGGHDIAYSAFTYSEAAGAPSISGPTAPSVPENTTTVGTYTASEAGAWGVSGTDASFFSVSSGGVLSFASAPNFENPQDAGANNVYNLNVTFTATSSGLSATPLAVAVAVTNVNEPPLAPTIGTATAGNASASVAFTPPDNTGRPAITGYTATSSPGGITGTGASSPIAVSGLTNGQAYTFTVTATNAEGTGPASAASNSVTPSAAPTAPSITAHPSNATVTEPATAQFTVAATGTAPLSYQWQVNTGTGWANVSTGTGGTTATYTTPATSTSMSGHQFRCVVSNVAGSVNSNAATLTVNAASPPPPPPPTSVYTDIIAIAGIAQAVKPVWWTWAPNLRPGAGAGTLVFGTGTTTSEGRLLLTAAMAGGSGEGLLLVSTEAPGATTAADLRPLFAQYLTIPAA